MVIKFDLYPAQKVLHFVKNSIKCYYTLLFSK